MSAHSELAERIERFPGELITEADRKLIVAALRATTQVCGACGKQWDGTSCPQKNNGWPHEVCYPVDAVIRAPALPSEEEIMKAINKGIQREQWRRDKPEGLGIRRRFSAARAVLALLSKTKDTP